MRVFYYCPKYDSIMSHWQDVHFIDELSRHGVMVHTFNPLLFPSWEEANEQALRTIKENHYDLFFTDICTKEVLFLETLLEIKRIGIPTLCLRCDNLVIPLYDKELAPYFDLVWLTSIETKRFYDTWGVNTCFAPYAANPYTFIFEEQKIQRRACFVGTPYGSRARMFNTLLSGGIDLTLFCGNSAKDVSTNNVVDRYETILEMPSISFMSVLMSRIRFKEGRKLIRGTLINKLIGGSRIIDSPKLIVRPSVPTLKLSGIYSEFVLSLASTSAVHTDVLRSPLKIINLRNFEIPMSGGIELCRYNPELANYFEEDKEILFYRNDEELVEKARYYLAKATDSEIMSIKRAARKRAENEHSWWNRFSLLFDNLGIN